ncbi:MAG: HlyC/CorC family transporter [Clostridia bacterium]|nr:HlyC/CorC family transporter [Clostridia bacterium]
MMWPLYVLVLIVLIAFSAVFSGSEIAYSSLNEMRLRHIADEQNDKRAKVALLNYSRYDNLLSTILIGNNFVNLAASAISTELFIILLYETGVMSENISAIISTASLTIVILIFGEIVPKMVAAGDADDHAMRHAGFLRVLGVVFFPLVWVVTKLVKLFSRGWTKSITDDTNVTEDELSDIIDTVEEEGVIDEHTSDLLQSALEFPDIYAYEIITPRVDMVAVDIDDDPAEILETILNSNYSRIPVYEGTIDNVIGVIHLNEVLKAVTDDKPLDLRKHMLPVCYIHKTTILPQALRELREKKLHLAIVTDEYGGTMGLLTMEDILEQIVGDIWDESDEIEDELVKLDDDTYECDGDMRIYDLLDELEIDDDDFDDDNATVGGWAIEQLGGYPAKGDSFDFENLTVTVKQMQNLRVTRLLIKVHEKPPEEDEDDIEWEKKDE